MPLTPEQYIIRVFKSLRKAGALNHPGKANTMLRDSVRDDGLRKDILDALFDA